MDISTPLQPLDVELEQLTVDRGQYQKLVEDYCNWVTGGYDDANPALSIDERLWTVVFDLTGDSFLLTSIGDEAQLYAVVSTAKRSSLIVQFPPVAQGEDAQERQLLQAAVALQTLLTHQLAE